MSEVCGHLVSYYIILCNQLEPVDLFLHFFVLSYFCCMNRKGKRLRILCPGLYLQGYSHDLSASCFLEGILGITPGIKLTLVCYLISKCGRGCRCQKETISFLLPSPKRIMGSGHRDIVEIFSSVKTFSPDN